LPTGPIRARNPQAAHPAMLNDHHRPHPLLGQPSLAPAGRDGPACRSPLIGKTSPPWSPPQGATALLAIPCPSWVPHHRADAERAARQTGRHSFSARIFYPWWSETDGPVKLPALAHALASSRKRPRTAARLASTQAFPVPRDGGSLLTTKRLQREA
jgi:hypothetical protein